jgi:hypothetical protein
MPAPPIFRKSPPSLVLMKLPSVSPSSCRLPGPSDHDVCGAISPGRMSGRTTSVVLPSFSALSSLTVERGVPGMSSADNSPGPNGQNHPPTGQNLWGYGQNPRGYGQNWSIRNRTSLGISRRSPQFTPAFCPRTPRDPGDKSNASASNAQSPNLELRPLPRISPVACEFSVPVVQPQGDSSFCSSPSSHLSGLLP